MHDRFSRYSPFVSAALMIFFTGLIILGCAPVISAEVPTQSGVTGDCTWTLVGTELTISGEGATLDYNGGSAPWGEAVTSVKIDEGVTRIGRYAFNGCKNLTEIDISEGVESIGDYAFRECTSIDSVELPDSVRSLGIYVFCNCTSLERVALPKNITVINSGMFMGCGSLRSIDIPEDVTLIKDNAFDRCYALSEITVDEKNTVYDSRNNCNALIETASDKLIMGCGNTVIPDSVVTIGNSAFYGCKGLTDVTIPEGVVKIGYCAFAECEDLMSVTIPESVVSIGEQAFCYCPDLKEVTILAKDINIDPVAMGYMAGDGYLHDNVAGYKKTDDFTIIGKRNSDVESHAKTYGFIFVDIDAGTNPILGDADSDAEVSVLDVTAIQRYLADLNVKRFNPAASDTDRDDSVTIVDATLIQRHLAGMTANSVIGEEIILRTIVSNGLA